MNLTTTESLEKFWRTSSMNLTTTESLEKFWRTSSMNLTTTESLEKFWRTSSMNLTTTESLENFWRTSSMNLTTTESLEKFWRTSSMNLTTTESLKKFWRTSSMNPTTTESLEKFWRTSIFTSAAEVRSDGTIVDILRTPVVCSDVKPCFIRNAQDTVNDWSVVASLSTSWQRTVVSHSIILRLSQNARLATNCQRSGDVAALLVKIVSKESCRRLLRGAPPILPGLVLQWI
ncbi:hypothetical protein ACHWQZ_G009650 [Mnemiopsis leidyi]